MDAKGAKRLKVLRARLTREEERLFREAARRLGLDLSSWVRMVLLREARK